MCTVAPTCAEALNLSLCSFFLEDFLLPEPGVGLTRKSPIVNELGLGNMFVHDCLALPERSGVFLCLLCPESTLLFPPVLRLKLDDLSREVSGVLNPQLLSLKTLLSVVDVPLDLGTGGRPSIWPLLNINDLLAALPLFPETGVLWKVFSGAFEFLCFLKLAGVLAGDWLVDRHPSRRQEVWSRR